MKLSKIILILFLVSFIFGCSTDQSDDETPIKQITIYCVDSEGNYVNGAVVLIDGNKFSTSSGRVTITESDLSFGSRYDVDFKSDTVWDGLLTIRNTINGKNVSYKDVNIRTVAILINANDLYLIKIKKTWDIEQNAAFNDIFGTGMNSFPKGDLPVVYIDEFNGDTTEAKRVLESIIEQANTSQTGGVFTEPGIYFVVRTSANNPRIDAYLQNILPQQAGHGGDPPVNNELNYALFVVPGAAANTRFNKTLQEFHGAATYTEGGDAKYHALSDGENLTELGKQVFWVLGHFPKGAVIKGVSQVGL